MIAREGYPSESHTVTTDDCYILSMHRIPHGKHENLTSKVNKPVVYLQHGLLCSSADWVMGNADNSLGFILADAGYDVWLGNYRGNTYSRAHCNLTPKTKEFWKFRSVWSRLAALFRLPASHPIHSSWDEMGTFDIPAMIDHILKVTGQEKIFYIGHSMGTTGFIVMANEKPEYQEHIHLAHFLAPVAYVDHMKSPIRYLAPFAQSIGVSLNSKWNDYILTCMIFTLLSSGFPTS